MSYLVDAFVDEIEWGPAIGRGTINFTREELPCRVPVDDVEIGSANVDPSRLEESCEFRELVRGRLFAWTGFFPKEFTIEIITVTHSSEYIQGHDL